MKLEYVEIGQIVNTHGVRGELKLNPWDIAPDLLCDVKTLYIENRPYTPLSTRVHKGCLLLTLPGIEDLNAALAFKGKVVSIRRDAIVLPEGVYFPAELIGLEAQDAETGEVLGKLEKVMPYPAHDVYQIRGKKEFLVPAVPAFVDKIDLDTGIIRIHVWEGLI